MLRATTRLGGPKQPRVGSLSQRRYCNRVVENKTMNPSFILLRPRPQQFLTTRTSLLKSQVFNRYEKLWLIGDWTTEKGQIVTAK